jgi:hypothetical protein
MIKATVDSGAIGVWSLLLLDCWPNWSWAIVAVGLVFAEVPGDTGVFTVVDDCDGSGSAGGAGTLTGLPIAMMFPLPVPTYMTPFAMVVCPLMKVPALYCCTKIPVWASKA